MGIAHTISILALIIASNAFQTRLNQKWIINNHNLPKTKTTKTRFEINNANHMLLHHSKNEEEEDHRSLFKKWDIKDRVFDTMKIAGYEDYSVQMSPKRFLIIFFGMMAFKYIRSKKLKQSFMEKQPAWGHVITSKDQEKNLHAWTCKECGSTMFIAKGREIRFFNPLVGIECQDCDAKGKDMFYDRREEIAAEDDTDFEYENPLDYISKEERKKKMKQMEKEKKKNDAIPAAIVATSDSEGEVGQSEVDKPTKVSDEMDDPLGMDL